MEDPKGKESSYIHTHGSSYSRKLYPANCRYRSVNIVTKSSGWKGLQEVIWSFLHLRVMTSVGKFFLANFIKLIVKYFH